LRQRLLRRPLSQPAVHGGEPLTLRAVRQHAGRARRLISTMHSVDSRYAWWRLAASVTLSTFGAVGMWGVVVIFPNLQTEFGATRAEVSFSYTTTMLGFGAGSILLGRLIDTRGAFVTMLLATVLLAGGYALAALAPTLWLFALVQGLIGFASAAS